VESPSYIMHFRAAQLLSQIKIEFQAPAIFFWCRVPSCSPPSRGSAGPSLVEGPKDQRGFRVDGPSAPELSFNNTSGRDPMKHLGSAWRRLPDSNGRVWQWQPTMSMAGRLFERSRSHRFLFIITVLILMVDKYFG
jgi:hypothetical protein